MELVNITLHGNLGDTIGKSWNLAVKSVGEAMRAIHVLSGEKLYKYFYENDKKGIKYKVVVNSEELEFEEGVAADTVEQVDFEKVVNSELRVKKGDLKTIDIVPVIEGSGGKMGGWVASVLGVILIVAGIIVAFYEPGLGVGMVIAGIGLLAAGISVLLSKPPSFEDFRENRSARGGYLFDGPVNTTREGGPIPIGYGRLLVGSQVVQTDYNIDYVDSTHYNTTS